MDRSAKHTLIVLLLAVVAVLAIAFLSGYGVSGQVRLDSGDLRYRFLGIPYRHERMPEPQRSLLLSIAESSEILKAEWHTCACYPLPTSNHTDWMCRRFYYHATAWVSVDPSLARLIVEDVASYVIETNAEYSLPDSHSMLVPPAVEWDEKGGARVRDGWQDDIGAQWYCEQKGYTLPAGGPTRRP